MAKWIRLDSDQLNPPTREKIRGVEVVVLLSAYDVPEAVGGDYDNELKKFVINFKYIVEDEPVTYKKAARHVTFRVGKNSGRLYGIEIDVDKIKEKSVNLSILVPNVVEAIGKLESNPRLVRRRGNYRLAKRVITENGLELLSALGAQ
jgi:hypothetical protein